MRVFFLSMLLMAIPLPLSSLEAGQLPPADLNRQGEVALSKGRPDQAIDLFRQAEAKYRSEGRSDGILGAQVNQAIALQALGLYPEACRTIVRAVSIKTPVCDQNASQSQDLSLGKQIAALSVSPAMIAAVVNLGNTLRVIGRPETSYEILARFARKTENSPDSQLLLSLANSAVSLHKRDREYDDAPASVVVKYAAEALRLYEQVERGKNSGNNLSLSLLSRVKQLQFLVDLEDWMKVSEVSSRLLASKVEKRLPVLMNELSGSVFDQLPAAKSIEAQLSVSQALQKLGRSKEALRIAQRASALADSIGDSRRQSHASGVITLLMGHGSESKQAELLNRAIELAESSRSWDLLYRWQEKLANIDLKQGRWQVAEKGYERAIEAVKKVSGDILGQDSPTANSVRQDERRIYKEYLRLLLDPSRSPQVGKAIPVAESIQRISLVNFLGCRNLKWIPLREANKSATIIYILDLDNFVAVIVESPGLKPFFYTANAEKVKDRVEYLAANVGAGNFYQVKESVLNRYSQILYTELLFPAKKKGHLKPGEQIVFSADPLFQRIPLALLHDGQKYLGQSNPLAMAIGGGLDHQKERLGRRPKALFAGLSKAGGLNALPEVENEISKLHNLTGGQILLNEQFTIPNLKKRIEDDFYPILHFSSHAQYSPNPRETFISAWGGSLGLDDIHDLVRGATDRDTPIYLLVLSACETAKGSPSSILGIAGIGAQAGAETTIASLWKVDSLATETLMTRFYQGLNKGLSKSNALLEAQMSLAQSEDFSHPFYWAGFIVIGTGT